MTVMTTHERIRRMYEHREADRVPIVDIPWPATIARWQHEGMPADVEFFDYLGMDCIRTVGADISPRFPVQVLEETEHYRVFTSQWGATLKQSLDRHGAPYGTPHRLDFTVKDQDSWRKAKERMQPDPDRIDWARLQRDYRTWRQRGDWISAGLWFGFEVTYSHMVGVPLFIAMVEEPEWVIDMVNTMLDLSLALLDMVWQAGYYFDQVEWPNDMGYKGHSFMSRQMYRDLFEPADRRAAEWAHRKGLNVYYHSCGNVNTFIPDWIDLGVNMLDPLEVKAGMDPLQLKAQYGEVLAFHGGLDARCYGQPEDMWAEMERVIPTMMESGGYIIGTDHSVPDSVSLDQYRQFVALAKRLGTYG